VAGHGRGKITAGSFDATDDSPGEAEVARILDQLVGHDQIVERFLAAKKAGRLPHTFLFVGPHGIGKKLTALALAQALICEKSVDVTGLPIEGACGLCGPCLRLYRLAQAKEAGGSQVSRGMESLLLIEPERSVIKVEQAREILEFLSLKALAPHRAVIIDGAETLNQQAANSLLKVLEEPPVGTFFFLIAPSPSQVLPTLQSRSQIVSFAPLTAEQMKKRTRAPEWAIRASSGSFEKLQMLTEKEELEIRESACSWLSAWMNEPQGYLSDEIRALARDRAVAQRLADHLLMLLRDGVFYQLGSKTSVMNLDKEKFLTELSELPAEKLNFATAKALTLQSQLQQNFDSSLLLEQFWIETRNGHGS
jgi:DNA polymerase-3 subunit delta'